MSVLRERLKPASELRSVSCDTQYSVRKEIKTGRWVACGQKQFIIVSAANFLKRTSKEIMYVEIN